MSSKGLTFSIDCKLKDPTKDREAIPYSMRFEASGNDRVTVTLEGVLGGNSPVVWVHASDLIRLARVLEVFEAQTPSSLTPAPRTFPEEPAPVSSGMPSGFR